MITGTERAAHVDPVFELIARAVPGSWTAGDAVARDIVDARRDLIDAQNAASASMVAHTLARLRLWQDMGILYITEDGSWMRVLKDEGDRDE